MDKNSSVKVTLLDGSKKFYVIKNAYDGGSVMLVNPDDLTCMDWYVVNMSDIRKGFVGGAYIDLRKLTCKE